MGTKIFNLQIFTLFHILFLLPLANSIRFNFPTVFNFGDSNSDTGNLVSAGIETLFPPMARATSKPLLADTVMAALSLIFSVILTLLYPHVYDLWPVDCSLFRDFVNAAVDAMNLPFLNPYLDSIGMPNFRKGCNFAAAASTILPASPTSLSPFSFGVQVSQFLRFKARVLEILAKGRKYEKYLPTEDFFGKGLYMFDIGQNDIAGAFYSKTLDQILGLIPTILTEFESGIKRLYDQGARNFWIHNTGPVGCLAQNVAKFGTDPSKLDDQGCVSAHNQAARTFNLQLHALTKKLQGQYTDANVTYVDIFTIKSTLIANYSKNGFEQPIMACCGYGGPPLNYDSQIPCGQTKVVNESSVTAKGCSDSSAYISWDGIHYTEAANQFVSSKILTGIYSDPPFADQMPFLLNLKF